MNWPIETSDVEAAAKRIEGWVIKTPLIRSAELDRALGADVFVKAECLQRTGAFKARGAANRLLALSDDERSKGVVAFSSGNHGQAVAFIAHLLGIKATIVMPKDAPPIKVKRTESHGATIITYDRYNESREEIANQIASETGAVVVPSFEDKYIMAGQGTCGLEAATQIKELGKSFDHFLVCTGGGGLFSGIAAAFKGHSPNTKLYTVEPEGYDDFALSIAAGERVPAPSNAPNICDAIVTNMPGIMPFQIANDAAEKGLAVNEGEVCDAMRFAADYLNVVAEPGGAVALAALLSGKLDVEGSVVGLTISGGNIDRKSFADIIGA